MAVKTTTKKAPAPAVAKTAPKAAAAKPVAAPTVTLKHLAAEMAEKHSMAKKMADTLFADLFETLVGRLKAGDRVRIGGLGILEVKSRPARMGRNPATGAAIEIKASKKVAFRAAKELKDAV